MTIRNKALLWAAIIISVALIIAGLGLSTGASFGVVSGLSGAAWATLATGSTCTSGCLQ